MNRWKSRGGKSQRGGSGLRKREKKEDAGALKGRKVATHCVFPMTGGSGGSKSRLAKAAGAEPSGQIRDEKLHAVFAQSTFPSQNVQSKPGSDNFWKVRCRKSARRCGAKHISKSKCKSKPGSDHFWKLRCRKSARRCGAKHISKTHQVRTTFGSCAVEKVHAVVVRSTFPSQNVQSNQCSDHFWKLRCKKSARRLWREAHFQVKMYKTHQVRTTFGRCAVEKVDAVVARSTFPSQKCQS